MAIELLAYDKRFVVLCGDKEQFTAFLKDSPDKQVAIDSAASRTYLTVDFERFTYHWQKCGEVTKKGSDDEEEYIIMALIRNLKPERDIEYSIVAIYDEYGAVLYITGWDEKAHRPTVTRLVKEAIERCSRRDFPNNC